MKTLLVAFVAGVLFSMLAGCRSSIPITRRTELADPVKTGEITLFTRAGEKYVLSNYRITDSTLIGAGFRLDSAGSVPFSGEFPLTSITYVHAASTRMMKTLVGIAGIIYFGKIIAECTERSPAYVGGVIGFHPPPYTGPSCPYLYAFDGSDYRFESETYAGAIIRNAERETRDVLTHLVPADGTFRLLLTNERPETHYTNSIALTAVDVRSGVEVIPADNGKIHTVSRRVSPTAARDLSGGDIRALLVADDSLVWRSDITQKSFHRDVDFTDGVVAEFPIPAGASTVKLLVKGKNTPLSVFAFERIFALKGRGLLDWYRRMECTPAEAEKFLGFTRREGGLPIFVWEKTGWVKRCTLSDVGPVKEKEQAAVLDCSQSTGSVLRIKIESATDLWSLNSLCVDYTPDISVRVFTCPMVSAVNGEGKNVAAELSHNDSAYFSTITGQHADIRFAIPPPVGPSLDRHFIVTTKGYYHQWFNNEGEDQALLVERILTEKHFGARLMMPVWKNMLTVNEASGIRP
jgi:hypothetical protein